VTKDEYHYRFANGLVLLGEPMPWLESVAVTIRVPAGSVFDPEGKEGRAVFTGEMMLRGAGSRDSRALVRELGLYGIHYAAGVGTYFAKFIFSTVSGQIGKGLELFADIVRRPQLPASQVENVRQGLLQDLRGLEDNPGLRLVRELRRAFYPHPWGRPASGEVESVSRLTLEDIREHYQRYYQPDGAIVAVAGRFHWPELLELVGEHFGDWVGEKPPPVPAIFTQVRYRHFPHPSQQVQIGVAFAGPSYAQADFFPAWAAMAVLGYGSTSRLFQELREKRGLCYGVGASYHSGRDRGGIFCYASTSADRAQETLKVLLGEIRRLGEGIRAEELERVKASVKSALIMSQESSAARAGVIARDWSLLGRVRSVEEIRQAIDALNAERINAYLQAHPPEGFVVVTVGPKELEVDGEL
jgi:predicted Zn-dependent peptidase